MKAELTIDRGPIYFISDVHLGAPGPPERERWLLDLLGEVPGRASALFVLGDLFDFWFEYRHAIPKGTFHIARAFAEIVESGIPVVYLGGNHDFWVGSYLRDEVGVTVYQHPIDVRLHGRMIHLAHGDGLGPGDGGYKVLKSVLRHPLAIWGYRSIHPDVGIPFAHKLSAWSRNKHTMPPEELLPRILRDVVAERVGGEVSGMIMGHVHEPSHYSGVPGSGIARSGVAGTDGPAAAAATGGPDSFDYLLIGDWLDNFTHVRLEDSEFGLYRRTESGTHVREEPMAFPLEWRPARSTT